MYGSSLARTYYGAGDYQTMSVMRPGYYAAGGFFGKLVKGIKKVGKVVAKPAALLSKAMNNPLLSGVLSVVPGGSMLKTAVGLTSSVTKALSGGGTKGLGTALKSAVSPKLLLSGATGGLSETITGIAKAGKAIRRARKKRRAPKRRSSSKRRARGDYGDDWVGNRPSRAKGSGQFLTKAGGRRRRRRRPKSSRRGRVSFTTKDGRKVSFTPRSRRKRSRGRRRDRAERGRSVWQRLRHLDREPEVKQMLPTLEKLAEIAIGLKSRR